MQKVNVIITDKTGTLTEGKPSNNPENFARKRSITVIAALNKNSEHPLSQAVLNNSEYNDSESSKRKKC